MCHQSPPVGAVALQEATQAVVAVPQAATPGEVEEQRAARPVAVAGPLEAMQGAVVASRHHSADHPGPSTSGP